MSDKKPFDVYQAVTDKIIESLETVGEYTCPWVKSSAAALQRPVNVLSGKRYNGVNVLSLWLASQAQGYSSNVWGTYKQWAERGCQVRKGERSSIVVFYKQYERGDDEAEGVADTDENGRRTVMFARASWAFNASQVEGYAAPELPAITGAQEYPATGKTARLLRGLDPDLRVGGDRAYYNTAQDYIRMPDPARFIDRENATAREAYFSVLFHELTHWSGHSGRMARQFGTRFGDNAYAVEELVAELGAAFLCAEVGSAKEPHPDHAAYLASWLRVLKADKKAVFTAASAASKAVDFMVKAAAERNAVEDEEMRQLDEAEEAAERAAAMPMHRLAPLPVQLSLW